MPVPLHHGDEGTAAGFDWTDAALIAVLFVILAAVGFGLWKLVQRLRS